MTNIFNVGGARVGVQVLPKPNTYLTGTRSAVQVRYQGHFLSRRIQAFAYKVKIYDPVKRTKFTVRHMHNVKHKYKSVAAL